MLQRFWGSFETALAVARAASSSSTTEATRFLGTGVVQRYPAQTAQTPVKNYEYRHQQLGKTLPLATSIAVHPGLSLCAVYFFGILWYHTSIDS